MGCVLCQGLEFQVPQEAAARIILAGNAAQYLLSRDRKGHRQGLDFRFSGTQSLYLLSLKLVLRHTSMLRHSPDGRALQLIDGWVVLSWY